MNKLKTNSYTLGVVLGVVLPILLFGLLFGVNQILSKSQGLGDILMINQMLLLSVIINLISLRYYFVNLKFEKTGTGILVITFLYIISYFGFIV
ncbi:MAG: hypothetical protein JEZ03_12480 [Bacteroidales bacterium]|nr:hypothetical protein [Bacteroidales bacterium]